MYALQHVRAASLHAARARAAREGFNNMENFYIRERRERTKSIVVERGTKEQDNRQKELWETGESTVEIIGKGVEGQRGRGGGRRTRACILQPLASREARGEKRGLLRNGVTEGGATLRTGPERAAAAHEGRQEGSKAAAAGVENGG